MVHGKMPRASGCHIIGINKIISNRTKYKYDPDSVANKVQAKLGPFFSYYNM